MMTCPLSKEHCAEKKKLKRDIRKRRHKIVAFINTLSVVPKKIRKDWIRQVTGFRG